MGIQLITPQEPISDITIFNDNDSLKSSITTYKKLTIEQIVEIYEDDLTPEDFNKLKLPFKY